MNKMLSIEHWKNKNQNLFIFVEMKKLVQINVWFEQLYIRDSLSLVITIEKTICLFVYSSNVLSNVCISTRASLNTQNCCSFPFENPFLIWCRRLITQIKHPRKLFTVKTHILVKLLPNTKNQTYSVNIVSLVSIVFIPWQSNYNFNLFQKFNRGTWEMCLIFGAKKEQINNLFSSIKAWKFQTFRLMYVYLVLCGQIKWKTFKTNRFPLKNPNI